MPSPGRNPPWSFDELVPALELYLQRRHSLPSKEDRGIKDLSQLLTLMGRQHGRLSQSTFRNANGVYMKLMNFRRFDPAYLAEGKVGLSRGNRLEEVVWRKYCDDLVSLDSAAHAIRMTVVANA